MTITRCFPLHYRLINKWGGDTINYKQIPTVYYKTYDKKDALVLGKPHYNKKKSQPILSINICVLFPPRLLSHVEAHTNSYACLPMTNGGLWSLEA